jgi:hypothetical protein
MKKFILLLSIVFVLMGLIGLLGCSDDDDNNNDSSISGVDLTDDDFISQLDTYMSVSGTDPEFRILISSKNEVTSSELTINDIEININNSWVDVSMYDENLNYVVLLTDEMLPAGLVIAPGSELDIKLEINGVSHNDVMSVAYVPNVEETILDLGQDFTVTWTVDQDPMMQVVSLYGDNYMFGDGEDFDEDAQLNGTARSYTFSKNIYSGITEIALISYSYGVDTFNYKLTGKHFLALASDNYIDHSSFVLDKAENQYITSVIGDDFTEILKDINESKKRLSGVQQDKINDKINRDKEGFKESKFSEEYLKDKNIRISGGKNSE